MTQYIDKNALVAKINNWIKDARSRYTLFKVQFSLSDRIESLENLLSFINTLEVKEVDLEKEYEEYVVDDPIFGNFITNDTMGRKLAKHFFELGLKAQKGE